MTASEMMEASGNTQPSQGLTFWLSSYSKEITPVSKLCAAEFQHFSNCANEINLSVTCRWCYRYNTSSRAYSTGTNSETQERSSNNLSRIVLRNLWSLWFLTAEYPRPCKWLVCQSFFERTKKEHCSSCADFDLFVFFMRQNYNFNRSITDNRYSY